MQKQHKNKKVRHILLVEPASVERALGTQFENHMVGNGVGNAKKVARRALEVANGF